MHEIEGLPMRHSIKIALNGIAAITLLVSLVWLVVAPDFEPLLALLGALGMLLGAFFIKDEARTPPATAVPAPPPPPPLDPRRALEQQLAELTSNLHLIEQRIATFVSSTDVPLQLEKDRQRCQEQIAALEQRLQGLVPQDHAALPIPAPVGDFTGREQELDVGTAASQRTAALPAPPSNEQGQQNVSPPFTEQPRRMIAAMPAQSRIHVPTEIWVQICIKGSYGFKSELPKSTDFGDEITKDDVKKECLAVRFPNDPKSGQPQSADVLIFVRAIGFKIIDSPDQTLRVPFGENSGKLVIRLQPEGHDGRVYIDARQQLTPQGEIVHLGTISLKARMVAQNATPPIQFQFDELELFKLTPDVLPQIRGIATVTGDNSGVNVGVNTGTNYGQSVGVNTGTVSQNPQNINNNAPNQGAQGTFGGPVSFSQGGTTFNQQGQNVGTQHNAGRDMNIQNQQAGGNISNSPQISGSGNNYVGGNVGGNVGGDNITGGVNITTSGTGNIVGGYKSNVQVQQGSSANDLAQAFAQVYAAIDARRVDPNVDKAELAETVQKIEAEAQMATKRTKPSSRAGSRSWQAWPKTSWRSLLRPC
ncbi:MAG: hypothetical protein HC911_06975 [Chloroflexaceae bacterium]|nr:hypothetical protein [Chloroflexaceae bacterium]